KDNPRLRGIYDARIQIIKLIREFFWRAGFVETDTPVAVRLASQEPYLNPVSAVFHAPNGVTEQFYLRTSPEYGLKKLLAAGYEKIFEIGKVFRDYEEFGRTHNTEFTMIEWYRAPGTLTEIMDDTENLFKFVASQLPLPRGRIKEGVWDRLSMKEVWQKYLGVNLDEYLELEKMRELVLARGFAADPRDAYEDLFFKIFLNEIEPKLGAEWPVFVYDYPQQMTSLNRLCEHDQRYAERFELYIGGLELANAFGELTDAAEQKKRLEEDKNKRLGAGKPVWGVDPDFIAAIAGLPEAARQDMAGIALGVDRMVLLFTGARDINEVMFQSVKDQIENINVKFPMSNQ
ncbi:EF-P lysine aminoacylase GenX, partial [Patescibacteria group bacterium]